MSSEQIDLYEILEISKDASKDEVRKAYRKAALANHPDKVPESDRAEADIKFKAISQAYEILYDDDKRHLYDTHGMSAFDGSRGPGGMGGEPDLEDMLAQMFGMGGGMGGMGGMPGMGGPGGRRKPRKSPNEEQKYEVSLEDLYKGRSVRFSSTKNVICGHCKGSGGKEKAKAKDCTTCQGQGVRMSLEQVGPGLVTQRMVPCSICKGAGKFYNAKDKCKKCKGERTLEEKKPLEIYIPRGARDGDKIVLEGEADQVPDQEPGDIIFHISETEHPTFKRAGSDLLAELTVTLSEALTGFSRTILTHLDGRGIELTYPKNGAKHTVLKPGQVLKVVGEGMPHKRSDHKGDLYLVVNVDFPDDDFFVKNAGAKEKLQSILPGAPPKIEADTVDEANYEDDVDIEEFGARDGRGGEAWEDEDDEGAQGAQCAQQ